MLGVVTAELVPVGSDLPAEADLHRVLIAGDKPAVRGDAPVVGDLGLTAVLELLLENAELITDGIARGLEAEGRHAVHVAGGETAEAAVAEARVRLRFKNIHGAAAHILQRAGERFADAEVEGVLHQAAAHEELHRHIVNFLFGVARILHRQKTAHELTDDHGGSLEDLFVGRGFAGGSEVGTELIFDGAAHLVSGNLSDHMGKYLQKYEYVTLGKRRRGGCQPSARAGG